MYNLETIRGNPSGIKTKENSEKNRSLLQYYRGINTIALMIRRFIVVQ